MASCNKVFLLGYLGKDAEQRQTPGGVSVANFSMATTRKWKDDQGQKQEETDWHDIVYWRSENVVEYLKKGRCVLVVGRLRTRSWEDQNGNKRYRTEVVATDLQLLPKGEGKGGRPQPQDSDDPGTRGLADDDVPF